MPNYELATRAQALALKLGGRHSNHEIAHITGISIRNINTIVDRAVDRGLDLSKPVILDVHVANGSRPGRPSKQGEVKDQILAQVQRDRYGREKTCAAIAEDLGNQVSAMTVWRVLRSASMKKTKPTRKPGLTEAMKAERLAWCNAHEHWTLDDWKQVIWSDETSVVLGHRRGGYRVWRTSQERLVKSVIRERWKGYSEFMFWACFSYDKKGPCHIWKPETIKARKKADEVLTKLNRELEPTMRLRWELETPMQRLGLRNKPGPQPQWKWKKETGKLSRGRGKGIDWWRYQQEVLIPKMIPFARSLGPNALVQEDKAPSHAHHAQAEVYILHDVQRLLWPGNSPDLNMIELAWPHLKKATTRLGAPTSRTQAEKVWTREWKAIPQTMIQGWIERISHHIQEVIRLEGGNEYKEGRKPDQNLRKPRPGKLAIQAQLVSSVSVEEDDEWEDIVAQLHSR